MALNEFHLAQPTACTCRYDGQEAVLTGIEAALTKQDSIVTSYRDHCHHISRGGTIEEVMAELFGRSTGATKGEADDRAPPAAAVALCGLCSTLTFAPHMADSLHYLAQVWVALCTCTTVRPTSTGVMVSSEHRCGNVLLWKKMSQLVQR
jgi:hypothetical protein